MAYGVDLVERFGKAASYVDRILKGDKTGELPVQGPKLVADTSQIPAK